MLHKLESSFAVFLSERKLTVSITLSFMAGSKLVEDRAVSSTSDVSSSGSDMAGVCDRAGIDIRNMFWLVED